MLGELPLIRSFKTTTPSTTRQGALAEDRALTYLQRQGLATVVRNYRCKGGEIDLIMRAADDTLVFVEVRQRSGRGFGGAAASITLAKQRRVLRAASHYLATLDRLPPCRVDVVALDPGRLEWLRNAFDLGALGPEGGDSEEAAS
jgi:putative endonuclease